MLSVPKSMRGVISYGLISAFQKRSTKGKFLSELFCTISLEESPTSREKVQNTSQPEAKDNLYLHFVGFFFFRALIYGMGFKKTKQTSCTLESEVLVHSVNEEMSDVSTILEPEFHY